MKRPTLALLLITGILASSCSTGPTVQPEKVRKAQAEQLFSATEGCFLLYNLRTKSYDEIFNKDYCYERTAACSTFKVPLAVMAADDGSITSEQTPFRWDRKARMIPAWNQDQTAASWMKESAVWVSQELTRKLGRKKVQNYLRDFAYGNRDFSGDIDGAWLTPAPFLSKEPRTSVKISPIEQVDFLEQLWRNELPVSAEAQGLARKLTYLEESPNGFTIHGKTGSGFVGVGNRQRLGWFVAHVQGNGKEYLAVTRFVDREPADPKAAFGGTQAKEITKKLLGAAGLW